MYICLLLGWLLYLLLVPLISFAGHVFIFISFIPTIIYLTKNNTMSGIIDLLLSLPEFPVVYFIELGAYGLV